jgi:hypothetical protein
MMMIYDYIIINLPFLCYCMVRELASLYDWDWFQFWGREIDFRDIQFEFFASLVDLCLKCGPN